MRRTRVRKQSVGVSLFPFLAVLICTMGALIVLLMLVVQMARVDASEDVVAIDPLDAPDAMQLEHATSQWRRDLWAQQLTDVQADVADHRLELSHLEQHIRELEQRWAALQTRAADIHLRLQGEVDDDEAVQAELAETQAEIERVRQALAEARAAAAARPPVYAIVPYHGPHGTARRPIYLECTEEGVQIQPEGVLLTPADFGGLLGPGNPLDATLRAIREYYRQTVPAGQASEPYPLLIVRPGGAETYALARSALRAWDDEFGYELVDAGMELDYPSANTQLAALMKKAIRDARSRQAALAAAMPSRFSQREETGVVASTAQGGFVPLSGADARRAHARRGGFGTGGDVAYRHGNGDLSRGPEDGRGTAADGNVQDVAEAGQRGAAGGHSGATSGTAAAPLAETRGRNWGLPGETQGATGITRPLRLACLPDRFILLPEQGTTQVPDVVLVQADLRQSIDALVARIWDRIDLWGIAVAGGYWKPVLVIDVAQGAEDRFRDLQTLLLGSGLEVQRRSP
jgi:hypothetical protein